MANLWTFLHSYFDINIIVQILCISLLNSVYVSGGEPPSGNRNVEYRMTMPNVTTSAPDAYLCIAVNLKSISNNPVYITGFRPDSDATRAHHMLLHKCNAPYKQEEGVSWNCLNAPKCNDQAQIIYGWARNADNLKLPDGVSFTLDPNEIHFLVLQVHYATEITKPDTSSLTIELSHDPTRYSAGIYLLLRSWLGIPAGSSRVHGDVNCKTSDTIHPFAFRTHAHQWATVIKGYK